MFKSSSNLSKTPAQSNMYWMTKWRIFPCHALPKWKPAYIYGLYIYKKLIYILIYSEKIWFLGNGGDFSLESGVSGFLCMVSWGTGMKEWRRQDEKNTSSFPHFITILTLPQGCSNTKFQYHQLVVPKIIYKPIKIVIISGKEKEIMISWPILKISFS